MEGWMDEQTLFYRTLPAKAGGPAKAITMCYALQHKWNKKFSHQ